MTRWLSSNLASASANFPSLSSNLDSASARLVSHLFNLLFSRSSCAWTILSLTTQEAINHYDKIGLEAKIHEETRQLPKKLSST